MEYIKQFITIVEQGTLTKGAEELHVSQSTLTGICIV
ncbi:LysR family transcriptional regulator [Solobacterium sp.]|nr:LysR family transcriptional regulator [Solobacterium sp.]MBF1118514.1 LysR family transcriptional regulator [Solobacterium sp.]